ncbi:MAG: folate family ECF transporter S component [Eubacteriales bacterium]|nr:folate family ECF transporter S component [Eubacteriales bacterium]
MKKFAALFTDSAQEFKNVRTIALCGLFAALAFVLESFSIQLTNYIKIGFSGIPNEMVDFLFGPVVGCIFAAVMDVFKWMVHPTGAYFFGYTLNAFLAGLIYGSFLYKKPIRIWRILAAKLLVAIIINVGLGTLWNSMLYGNAFWAILPARFIKNIVLWPFNSGVLYLILKILEISGVFRLMNIYVPGKKRKASGR